MFGSHLVLNMVIIESPENRSLALAFVKKNGQTWNLTEIYMAIRQKFWIQKVGNMSHILWNRAKNTWSLVCKMKETSLYRSHFQNFLISERMKNFMEHYRSIREITFTLNQNIFTVHIMLTGYYKLYWRLYDGSDFRRPNFLTYFLFQIKYLFSYNYTIEQGQIELKIILYRMK